MTAHSQFPSQAQPAAWSSSAPAWPACSRRSSSRRSRHRAGGGARFGEGASSLWAQAGIAAAIAEGDSPDAHAADTIAPAPASSTSGSRISWRARRATASPICCRYGVPFDHDLEGHFSLGREAAHGRNRIVHVKGDTAGRGHHAGAAGER